MKGEEVDIEGWDGDDHIRLARQARIQMLGRLRDSNQKSSQMQYQLSPPMKAGEVLQLVHAIERLDVMISLWEKNKKEG